MLETDEKKSIAPLLASAENVDITTLDTSPAAEVIPRHETLYRRAHMLELSGVDDLIPRSADAPPSYSPGMFGASHDASHDADRLASLRGITERVQRLHTRAKSQYQSPLDSCAVQSQPQNASSLYVSVSDSADVAAKDSSRRVSSADGCSSFGDEHMSRLLHINGKVKQQTALVPFASSPEKRESNLQRYADIETRGKEIKSRRLQDARELKKNREAEITKRLAEVKAARSQSS